MRVIPFAMLTLTLMGAAFLVSACGPDKEPMDAVSWPFMESTESLTINGKEFNAYVAATELHRRRALNGLAIKEGQVIVLLYPDMEDPLEIELNSLPDPVDLVYVGRDGKALKVEEVPAFSESNFPRKLGGERARVVLKLPKGMAKELSISSGSDVKTSPDLIERSSEAEGRFMRVFFLRNMRGDQKPEEAPFARVKLVETPEEAARLMKDRDDLKDGEGVMVPLMGKHHEFWVKEVSGKVSACYIDRAGGRGMGGLFVSAIYENLEDTGVRDLDRPMFFSPGEAQYLVMVRGGDFFSRNRIERRSPVTTSAATMESVDITYDDLEIKIGDTKLDAWLAREPEAREHAMRQALALRTGKAIVLAWDDPSFVEIDAPAGANLWFVGVNNGKYSIAHKEVTRGGKVEFKATSRFVIAVPPGFDGTGELDFPYRLRDLKPSLPAVVFYQARQAEIVTDRWPGADNNFKARARVELALTEAEQRRGLMFRESLKTDHGMLFIYQRDEPSLSYWMKNCVMNLSIAFVDSRGVIVTIHNNMIAPESGTPDHELARYEATAPARFAIEMRENWFKDNNVQVGDRVFIPPALTKRN